MGALEFLTKAEAQAAADKIHAWMIANHPEYAKSVSDGQTLRWAIPYESKLGWAVNVKPRATDALTTQEKTALKTFSTVEKTVTESVKVK